MDSMYAVLTGDVVDFTKLAAEDRQHVLDVLTTSFEYVRRNANVPDKVAFDRFRGDSFQGVIPDPRQALQAAVTIRAMFRSAQPEGSNVSWDARVAVGIGKIEVLPKRVTEGDGEAFLLSGPALDGMKGRRRLSIHTSWPAIDEEMDVSTALLDAVIAKWSPKQAEVVLELLQDQSQEQIAASCSISQSAVSYRVQGAGWFAVERFLERYRKVIHRQLQDE
jgi:hypothetical protein